MDEQSILGKYFEFDNDYFKEPKKYGPVNLIQMGELCCECGFEIEPHIQTCNEISCIISGQGCFRVNGERYPVQEGDLFINQKGELHAIQSLGNEKLRFLYIGFELNMESQEEHMKPLYDFFSNPIKQRTRHDKLSVMAPFLKMLNEVYSVSSMSDEMVKCYLIQVLILTYRTFNDEVRLRYFPQKNVNVVGSTVYSVIKYIDNNIMEIDSVRSIADSLGYSNVYLSHLFRNKTGMTLQNYVNYKKIEKSLELIDSGKMRITQIALMLNFDTVQSFSKAFKRTLGFSPTHYKKEIGHSISTDE